MPDGEMVWWKRFLGQFQNGEFFQNDAWSEFPDILGNVVVSLCRNIRSLETVMHIPFVLCDAFTVLA